MPTFENGWICRECWSANREQDQRCYRCHKVPQRHVMPEPATFSTQDGKPNEEGKNEERKRVSSLIGSSVPREPGAVPEPVATPVPPAVPVVPLSERIRGLVFFRWARSAIAAITGTYGRVVAFGRSVMSFGRAVAHAPGAGASFVIQRVRSVKQEAGSRARSALSHRRAWLSAAWAISAVSSALLFSAALHASFVASLLVVASVAIFSGLTAAITTNATERQAHGIGRRSTDEPAQPERTHTFVPAPDHPAQPGEVLGSRPAR